MKMGAVDLATEFNDAADGWASYVTMAPYRAGERNLVFVARLNRRDDIVTRFRIDAPLQDTGARRFAVAAREAGRQAAEYAANTGGGVFVRKAVAA